MSKNPETNRPLISLLMFCTVLGLNATGLLNYIWGHSNKLAAVHTVFGITFLVVQFFHIKNNWSSIKRYIFEKAEPVSKLRREFIYAVATVLIIFGGSFFYIPPFSSLVELGLRLRGADKQAHQHEEPRSNHHLQQEEKIESDAHQH